MRIQQMSKMIPAVQREYGCWSVSVTYYSQGFWGASLTSSACPTVKNLGTFHDTNPRLALAKLCEELDFLLLVEEEEQKFQAAAAAWFKRQSAVAKAA